MSPAKSASTSPMTPPASNNAPMMVAAVPRRPHCFAATNEMPRPIATRATPSAAPVAKAGSRSPSVPNELTRKILEAGVCAPSGGNMQRWRLLVVRDPKVKQTVGAYYKRSWDEQVAPRYRSGEPAPGTSREWFERVLAAAEHLANHIHEVWIVPCLEGGTPTRTSGSSIYPAVQNMLLAARALGLGATLTTLYLQFEKEAEAALGLPPNVHTYALLPIGYPMGRFGPVRRIPLADVVYEDRWDQPYRDPKGPRAPPVIPEGTREPR